MSYSIEQRRANHLAQLERWHKATSMNPYAQIIPGPKAEPCPLHADAYDWLYRPDSPVWTEKPLNTSDDCWCRLQPVGRVAAERMKESGMPKYPARPILNGKGLPTGHVTFDRTPLKGIR